MITENYLDEDVAYLLGLIVMRGELHDNGLERRVVIEFPFRSLQLQGCNQKLSLELSVYRIRERIQELTGSYIRVDETNRAFFFSIKFLGNTIMWRNLRYLLGNNCSYREFQIPSSIMSATREVKIEFLRGVADVGGFIRESNRYKDKRYRVYLEVHNHNWFLPIQLCALLQQGLNVPVQLIQWGHPNMREPKGGKNWSREHQVKIFADAFETIGFTIEYKNKILNDLADKNRRLNFDPQHCSPRQKKVSRKKSKHTDEGDEILPPCLRGNHYDAYWQICCALGCKQ